METHLSKPACILFSFFLISCDGVKNSARSVQPDTVKPSWQYGVYEDKMYNSKTSWARIDSSNAPSLPFPYQGGSPVSLELTRRDEEDPDDASIDVILANGQFDCIGGPSDHNTCYLSMQIDRKKPVMIRGTKWDCGKDQCLTLRSDFDKRGNQPSLIPDIMNAKKITLRIPLYKFGSFDYEFEAGNLNWAK
jgi:hypothetical protein